MKRILIIQFLNSWHSLSFESFVKRRRKWQNRFMQQVKERPPSQGFGSNPERESLSSTRGGWKNISGERPVKWSPFSPWNWPELGISSTSRWMSREEASPGSPLLSATGSQRRFSNIILNLRTFWKRLDFSRVIQGSKNERNTAEEEPDEGRSILKDSSMTMLIQPKKGGHGTSLFLLSGLLGYWVMEFLGLIE